MIHKITKKDWAIIAVAGVLCVSIVGALIISSKLKNIKTSKEKEKTEIEEYREMIGEGMTIKKAVFIIFNTKEECEEFIKTHGQDKEPQKSGIGVVPLMKDGYYNIVGKTSLEEAFDNLKDGEYSKEPIPYSGKYCYLKRIGINNPIDTDEKLQSLIDKDKENAKKGTK